MAMTPFLLLAATVPQSALKLPSIFSDHMVLQRDMPIPFFGSARPGSKIKVQLGSRFATTTAKADGTWLIKLRPMEAGGPHTVTVSGDGTVQYRDVMVGEVWVASGQSNMEWPVSQSFDVELAQKEADSRVREFAVTKVSVDSPAKDVTGGWKTATPNSVLTFSAVGYWFATDLRKWLNVPVGVIHTSWGGTPAEAWTSRDALEGKPALAHMVRTYLDSLKDYPQRKATYDKAYADWRKKVFHEDPSNEGYYRGYADLGRDTSDWRKVSLPNLIEVTEGQAIDGAVWYRRTIDIPAEWVGKDLKLELGPVDDFDDTYFNGRKVGKTDEKTPFWYAVPREYVVPRALVRPGANVVTIRVFDQFSRGGFTGATQAMKLSPVDGSGEPMMLGGEWLSKVEHRFEPASEELIRAEPQRPFGPGNPWVPSGLYNGMVAPVVGYGIRGAIWYQGESNAGRAHQYRELFPTMIQNWRRKWGQGDFPFYWVSLANFTERLAEPADSEWAELREAQTMTLSLPKTGQALAIDIGEANDIHPRNKREVGRRLALNALARDYGVKVEFAGPTYRTMKVETGEVRLEMDHADGLKTTDGRDPVGFAVAGADRKFRWAKARIEGTAIVLSHPEVPNPVAVRYAWANNPEVNLVNGSGLPATPFRTDDWPGLTVDRK